jgi:hypothetical protein
MPEPLRILSLGAGVQSSTVLLMSCVGELPKLGAAIFADTGWEPRAVYEHLEWLETEAEKASIPVYRVSAGDLRADALRSHGHESAGATEAGEDDPAGTRAASLPLYTRNADGTVGAIKRQCTSEYKVAPVEKQIRLLLGLKPRQPWPKTPAVELWFGITCDEARRMRLPGCGWKTHEYPLVEKRMVRHGCVLWTDARGFRRAPRSACKGCPFHSNAEWRAIQDDPEDWADVVAFDEAIRSKGGMRGEMFLHRSGVPLVQLALSSPEERGQQSLFDGECLGYCGN